MSALMKQLLPCLELRFGHAQCAAVCCLSQRFWCKPKGLLPILSCLVSRANSLVSCLRCSTAGKAPCRMLLTHTVNHCGMQYCMALMCEPGMC
jgi:hypothetical protein